MDLDVYRDRLCQYAHEYEIDLSQHQADLLISHLNLVIQRNATMNLTAITDMGTAVVKHIVDSLLFVRMMVDHGGNAQSSFLDIGTGAGYPGIPIAVTTGSHGQLIDSARKKAEAVTGFITELGLRDLMECTSVRAEEYSGSLYGHFDFVVARAVADTSVLLEYAAPLLRKDGLLIVSKANPSDVELLHADLVMPLCGMHHVSRETFQLPDDVGRRVLFLYEKNSEAKVKLPRRPGMALHKPLWQKTVRVRKGYSQQK